MPMPTTFRGPTAKGILQMQWDYPVYSEPEQADDGGTRAKRARKALSREEALAFVAGDDPRPLLVLRECKVCNGTDEALLKGGIENERTFLLARWFHCVKLPADVLEEDHPFHALFLEEQPEHLFVSSTDGSNHTPLESQTSRSELWKHMKKLLAVEYEDSPDKALKKLNRTLDKLDQADERWNELSAKRDDLLEKEGPKSRRLKKLDSQLEDVTAERTELKAELAKAFELELKARAGADEGAAAAEAEG